MSVRVLTDYGSTVTHDDATHFAVGGQDDGTLVLSGAPDGWPIATYARGRWVSAQRVAAPDPEPPLLKPGTVVRIPGIDVPYVVDKGLATAGPHATLTFTTVDGRDWAEDRTVNAAAEPDPRDAAESVGDYAANGSRLRSYAENAAATAPYPDWAKCPSVTLVPKTEPAEAVLSETTEPYVCVSVTGPDPDTVAKTLARLA